MQNSYYHRFSGPGETGRVYYRAGATGSLPLYPTHPTARTQLGTDVHTHADRRAGSVPGLSSSSASSL